MSVALSFYFREGEGGAEVRGQPSCALEQEVRVLLSSLGET